MRVFWLDGPPPVAMRTLQDRIEQPRHVHGGPAVVAGLQLPGGGEWIERPHTAVAGMAFYFFALAAFKVLLARRHG